MCIAFSRGVCSHLLGWPEETNTGGKKKGKEKDKDDIAVFIKTLGKGKQYLSKNSLREKVFPREQSLSTQVRITVLEKGPFSMRM